MAKRFNTSHRPWHSFLKTCMAVSLVFGTWWVFSADDLFARLARWHAETSVPVQVFDAVLLAIFLFANLLVIAFALRPSGALYLLPKSPFRKKLMQDMNTEQMQMPRLYATLRKAVAQADQARATRWLAVCYALLFALPTWWIFWAQRHIAAMFKDGCLASTQAFLQLPVFELWQPHIDCLQTGRAWGNLVGGVLLFTTAVFFRSRLQVALRGFARFHRRDAGTAVAAAAPSERTGHKFAMTAKRNARTNRKRKKFKVA